MKIISLGLGVQSSTLYLMSSTGFIEKADYAIFADPGAEHPNTYEYLKYLMTWQQLNNGIPIIHTGKKSLYNDLLNGTNSSKQGNKFYSIPAFTLNANGKTGILRRQCTVEYKVIEVDKTIRSLYGLKFRERNKPTELWIGISLDEIQRMKISLANWKKLVYPLITLKYTRQMCLQWLTDQSFEIPGKSACVFCPFQEDHRWDNLKNNYPAEWGKAVQLDKEIRNKQDVGKNNPLFLHRSCKPLSEIHFNVSENKELMQNECEGYCGV